MELLEDNILRNKLNSLDTLPEGYTPNIGSKWSMLEAGLEGQAKRKVFAWKPYAAAAILLILGGATFMLTRNTIRTTVEMSSHTPAVVKSNIQKKTLQGVATPIAAQSKKAFKQRMQQYKNVAITVPVEILQPETTKVQELQPETEQLVAHTPKIKKSRFVEVDFKDTPVTVQKPSESVMAAQQFRFKVGISSMSSGRNYNSSGGTLRLQQSF